MENAAFRCFIPNLGISLAVSVGHLMILNALFNYLEAKKLILQILRASCALMLIPIAAFGLTAALSLPVFKVLSFIMILNIQTNKSRQTA